MKNFFGKTRQRGQTLLEMMIALGVITAVLSAMVVVVLSSLTNEQFGTSQNQATQFAQEGIDVLRNVAQSNWSTILGYSSTNYYCLAKFDTALTASTNCANTPNIDSKFIREIKIEPHSCDPTPPPASVTNVRITSTVKWSDGRCGTGAAQYCHKVQLVSCLFKS